MSDTPSQPAERGLSRLARRAPIALFLAGTFAWAWILWGYWLVAMPPTGIVISPAFVVCAIVGGLAPSLAALATSWLIGRGVAAGALLRRLSQWRAPPVHFVLALAIVPAVTFVAAALLPVVTGGPLHTPDPAVMAMAAIWPVMAALGEELGWRGFLFPRLAGRYGMPGAALVIGLLWGVWHLPADFVGLKGYGGLFWLAFLVNGPFVLTAHALIMAWLWRLTGGNLLLMVLYHWSITATAMLAPAAGGQDWAGLASAAFTATMLWLVAIALWTLPLAQRPPMAQRRSPDRHPS